MSRLSNSEKYIVCKGFKRFNPEIINILNKYYDHEKNLYLEIPHKFIEKINEYNNIFVKNQIDYINKILQFDCKNISDKIKFQIKNSYEWCIKYNIPINLECIYLN